MDETYIKVKGKWHYLYRAVDKERKAIDFLLNTNRDKLAAKRFLLKARLLNYHNELLNSLSCIKKNTYKFIPFYQHLLTKPRN
ncbi:DDE-type integrase/transposase/recombinase [Desulfocastanea catecholica]